jgi:hypothetical protein
MSDLYCLKCRKYHHHNSNKCNVLSLIPVTRRCRKLADTLFELSVEPFSVGHFTYPVVGSENRYVINIFVELQPNYTINILSELPIQWRIYTETYSSDRTKLVIPILAYYENYCYDGIKTVDDRVQEVVDEFIEYLNEHYDADGIRSVLTLMYD